jgi:hypothetical protein
MSVHIWSLVSFPIFVTEQKKMMVDEVLEDIGLKETVLNLKKGGSTG